MTQLLPGARIHIVGIGGAGLSAIARILLARGCRVSGSDMRPSPVTAALAAEGATIFTGHDASYVDGASMILATSAAPDDHVELAAARQLGIALFRRREFMPILLRGHDAIAIAGTHGKTTTTSMIIHILQAAGKDPSFIVGGALGKTGQNAKLGSDRAFVIEADEYGNMFHGLSPQLAVLTTAEHDHPDFFATHADMIRSFEQFVHSIRPGGRLVACADDATALAIAKGYQDRGGAVSLYAIDNPAADWRAGDIQFSGEVTSFQPLRLGMAHARVELKAPGRHNIQNALAAMALAHELGVDMESCARALHDFRSSARRFEHRGSRDGLIVIDDYAHHPTEIEVNIAAARSRYPGHAIIAIWQPHTYSRVRQFWSELIDAFREADRVLVTPIYAAREAPLAGINSRALASAINSQVDAAFAPDFESAARMLQDCAPRPAVALIFSAGDANQIADIYLRGEA